MQAKRAPGGRKGSRPLQAEAPDWGTRGGAILFGCGKNKPGGALKRALRRPPGETGGQKNRKPQNERRNRRRAAQKRGRPPPAATGPACPARGGPARALLIFMEHFSSTSGGGLKGGSRACPPQKAGFRLMRRGEGGEGPPRQEGAEWGWDFRGWRPEGLGRASPEGSSRRPDNQGVWAQGLTSPGDGPRLGGAKGAAPARPFG
jgi:hypothetical protein